MSCCTRGSSGSSKRSWPRAHRTRPGRRWADWDPFAATWGLDERRPPLRVLLIWDNLTGHLSLALGRWLIEHGVLPLFAPLAGSWLNLAESIQRILARRALDGQHPETAQQVMDWLAEAVRGWNTDPTPFAWGGKRAARRARARARRHALSGSGAYTLRPIRGRRQRRQPGSLGPSPGSIASV
jgi:hypothetical protein